MYRPGMILYGECAGEITERQTGEEVRPGYASVPGLDVPFINIPSHYAFRESAEEAVERFKYHSEKFAGINQRRFAA